MNDAMKQLDAMFASFTRGVDEQMYQEFIKTLFEFVDKLIMVFPKYDSKLRDARNKLAAAVGNGNSKEILDEFMKGCDPYKEAIVRRDESVLEKLSHNNVFAGMNVWGDWSSVSDRIKNVLWAYLQQMLIQGTKCKKCEKVFEPMKDAEFKNNLFKTTLQLGEQYERDIGHEITSMDDIKKLADQINTKMATRQQRR